MASRPLPDLREGPPDLQEGLPDHRVYQTIPPKLLGGPPDPSLTYGMKFQSSWTSRRTSRPLPDHSMGLSTPLWPPGGPPNSSWISGRVFQPHPDPREGLPSPPGHPGRHPDPSQSSRRDSRPLPDLRKALTVPSHPIWTFSWASRLFPDLREGLPTPPGPPGGPPNSFLISGRTT